MILVIFTDANCLNQQEPTSHCILCSSEDLVSTCCWTYLVVMTTGPELSDDIG